MTEHGEAPAQPPAQAPQAAPVQPLPAPSYEIADVVPGSLETIVRGFSLPDPRPPDESTLTEVNLKMNRVSKEIEGLKIKFDSAAPGKDKASAAANLQAKQDEWERLRRKTLAFRPNLIQR